MPDASLKAAPKTPVASGDDQSITVAFETGRWRHAGWAAFGLVVGVALIVKLAVVGKWLGVVLLALGAYNVARFAVTLLRPAGVVRVSADEVRLPRGLCSSEDIVLAPDEVTHAYFLRRAVPWAKAGPILVIEALGGQGAGRRRFSFPRDWFASDADQRRIARALNRRLGRLP